MKRLIMVCGANGVGKTTACQSLVKALNHSAYIDSDWCRAMNPFSFGEETIQIIKSNIVALMMNYFKSSFIEHVIFPYGFHGPRKQIFEDILKELDNSEISYRLCPVILKCDLEENIKRMKKDSRDEKRVRRVIENTRDIYDAYDYPKIDTTNMSTSQTVD